MYNPCNEITPLVEVYQRWLNDHTRLAVRYGISTRKTHHWHTLTTTGITLADGRRVAIVVPSCLLPVSPGVREPGNVPPTMWAGIIKQSRKSSASPKRSKILALTP